MSAPSVSPVASADWVKVRERWSHRVHQLWPHAGNEAFLSLSSLPPSAQAFVIAALAREQAPLLIRAPDVRAQEELANDLEAWAVPFVFYPQIDPGVGGSLPDQDLVGERFAVLDRLSDGESLLVLSTLAGVTQPVPPAQTLRDQRRVLRTGQELDRDTFLAELAKAGYQREAEVTERGAFCLRGAVLDVFSWHAAQPVRLEWFGDEIESIREFDPVAQTSVRAVEETVLSLVLPAVLEETDEEAAATLADYLPKATLRIDLADDPESFSATKATPLEFYAHDFLHAPRGDFIMQEKRRDLFLEHLEEWLHDGWEVAIFCNNEGEQKRLLEIIREMEIPEEGIAFIQRPLLRGFLWPEAKLVVLSDAEIFGRYQTLRAMRRRERLAALRAHQGGLDFTEIAEGDYVVHLHHGIALYAGLQTIPSGEGEGDVEALALEFSEGAKLYVPLEQAYLVSRYVGVGKRHPSLDALGGSRWERAKKATRRAVLDYAASLLKVHAERESVPGHPFPPDTPWQEEFEQAFLYTPTTDQLKAIQDVKTDMEGNKPTDRLICGDVGFGKTEVAIRAAFKAVMGGKQVAFLVPTTVLAQQHYQNLRERFADYPIRVDVLSRFRTMGQQRQTVKDLASGAVDVVIGTHRLISKDVAFKDLGLVVVDEEQRFGVRQKERFKERFRLVDLITLSATPIPRTLYLSLTGARDLSVIETPPANRIPVETTVGPYDERVIREAIRRELARNGQVFFLHNRVQSIRGVQSRLEFLVPEARVDVGHGQMDEHELEDVMARFVSGETDVLLSTTIIESGLDIPNANTILIDRADRFGLADLYQLRGRVGRAQHKAYAYLLLPPALMAVGDARKRVNAIKQYSQLGAGFKIAMRDLEIRGAGNLLGTAQSGHITAVGFDLYCQLLKQAVATLKGERPARLIDTKLDLDFLVLQETDTPGKGQAGAFLPRSYVPESRWRIEAYRRLAELQNVNELKQLRTEWRDRFGPFPREAEHLLLANDVRLRAAAARIRTVETQDAKLMLSQGEDFVMIGGRFPRLTGKTPLKKLREISRFLDATKKD